MDKKSGMITSFIKHPATLVTAGIGAATGTGFLSYKKGKNVGARAAAERVANEFTNSFTAANEEENKRIVADVSQSFKNYNNKENEEIAKHYFNKGIQMSQMKKQAMLRIYNEAFEDEINKMAGFGTAMRAGLSAVGSGLKKVYGATMTRAKRFGGTAKREWGTMTPKQKALLGIAAGTGTAAGVGGGVMAHGTATRNDRISRYPKRMERLGRDRERMGL